MNNEQPQEHKMALVTRHPAGEEEWYCQACGRRILMTWPPNYKKVVLEMGDETAVHNGGKGGVSLQATHFAALEGAKHDNDPHLDVWSDWMNKINFDGLWE